MTAIEEARRWLGYLEHKNNKLLGVYTANIGKGGCTAFAEMISNQGGRNLSGLPWCATFVHAVYGKALGASAARKLLGSPHPGTRKLARRMRRSGRFCGREYIPNPGDVIFLSPKRDGVISHCGIVEGVEGDAVTSIDGNTVDPAGHFPPEVGGAVARRTRQLADAVIVGYGALQSAQGNGNQYGQAKNS